VLGDQLGLDRLAQQGGSGGHHRTDASQTEQGTAITASMAVALGTHDRAPGEVVHTLAAPGERFDRAA